MRRSPLTAERTILIVDDSLVTREIATVALEQAGWEATSVTSGEEGVTAAAAQQPDAVLLDVELPGMDGPATLAALRRGRLTRAIPVVFLTGHDDPGLLAGLVGLGAAGVLTKPVHVALLPGQLSALLGWRRMRGAAGETAAPLRREGSPPPLLAHAWARHRTTIFEQV
ncbi:MAG TPA: response regulator, partial [Conexibacter sp.]|nr:response regulator [Conexibacter sp.]